MVTVPIPGDSALARTPGGHSNFETHRQTTCEEPLGSLDRFEAKKNRVPPQSRLAMRVITSSDKASQC